MRRGRYIALLVVACVVALAAVIWFNRPQDEPTKATVDDAVRSFRENGDRDAEEGDQGEPALGVYRYATRGSESAQTAVGSATHDYRGISTITLSNGRCGSRERWQVLAGRWAEGETCPPSHGKVSARLAEFHEFFGFGQEDSFSCSGVSVSMAELRRSGTHFSSTCMSDNTSISNGTRVVGVETVPVGGEKFDAIHSTTRSLLEGETSGSGRRDEWRRRSDGLLLRRSASSDAETSSPGGDTQYNEDYTLQLLAVTPRR
jgi:hypothetical protein